MLPDPRVVAFLQLARHHPERLIPTCEAMGLPVSVELRQAAANLIAKKRVRACGRATSFPVCGRLSD